jgi:hypothetical protein
LEKKGGKIKWTPNEAVLSETGKEVAGKINRFDKTIYLGKDANYGTLAMMPVKIVPLTQQQLV